MFTGIIQQIGTVADVQYAPASVRLVVELEKSITVIKNGSSVCISGVCLTVTKISGKRLWFDVMNESLKKTTLADLKKSARVNVEPSLRIGDEVGGHFVFGHVDDTGEIKEMKKLGNSVLITVTAPKELLRYIVPQGSITIDGVSLTVAKVEKGNCMVSLVDFTLANTTLKFLAKGDRVNLEADMLAKYVSRRLSS